MAEIQQSPRAIKLLHNSLKCCKGYRHEFLMPEYLLMVLLDDYEFNQTFDTYYSADLFQDRLEDRLEKIEMVPVHEGDSLDYYRRDGVHFVPKLTPGDLTIG